MTDLFSKTKRDGFVHDVDRENGKEEWLTPPDIIKAFGPFDLDPCAPVKRPWPTAKQHFTIQDNGLLKPWEGFVFCNPPYGSKTGDWLKRCAEHNNCLVLIFARTETAAFQKWVWPRAKSIFFFEGRIAFHEFACAVCGQGMSKHKKDADHLFKSAAPKAVLGGGKRRSIRPCGLRRARRSHAARQWQDCWPLHREQADRYMTRAVYIKREDGDWDFVCAFAEETLPQFPSDWPEEIAEHLRENEGEDVCVIRADLAFLPDVLDGDSSLIPGNPTPGERANGRSN